VTTYAYDHRNRLTGATVKDAAGRLTGVTTYAYDPLDRRIAADALQGPTYLSDLPFSATQDIGGGSSTPVRRDTSANPALPLSLDGITYPKGLGAHAESTILVDLGGQYERFRAVVGINDAARPGGRVAFRVYDARPTGDVLLYDSGEIQGGAAGDIARHIDIGVAGVQTLKLYVDPLGVTSYDWADWADAHLIPIGDVAYLSDLPFSATQVLDSGATPSVGLDTRAGGTQPIRLDGITYPKGLGAHAYSTITLDLDAQYDRFRAVVGINDDARPGGRVAFRVYDEGPTSSPADDVLLYDSGEIWGGAAGDIARRIDIAVAGVETLKLVVDPLGVTSYDWADWADAHLTPKSDLGLTRAVPGRTWTAYDGINPYADFDADGQLSARYLHGPAVDWLLARSDARGATDWYLTDRLGSVRALADAQGAVIDRLDYDAFGNLSHESGPAHGDRFKFTGRELDAVTGLQSNRARYYDAAIGRWTQEDPIGFAAGDANLYRYVGNGPTNFTDPSGLYSDPLNEQLDRLQRSGRGFRPFSPVTQSRVSRQAVAQLQVAAAATGAFTENLGSSRSLDTIQAGLDVVGTAEPTPFADTFNAFVSLARGNLRDALLTLAGVIPYAGDGFKSLKYTDEVAGVVCTATTRIDVLPSNQLVSRFDTVTNAPTSGNTLSPSNYPNPDPPMSAPPVRYEPQSIDELIRMRQGKGPTTKATLGRQNIEAHHRQQRSVENGGILDELEMETHRGPGNHTRHSRPSELTPAQRAKEIREHWLRRGGEYILPGGEGI
jgi:RHS repeat-associated protein